MLGVFRFCRRGSLFTHTLIFSNKCTIIVATVHRLSLGICSFCDSALKTNSLKYGWRRARYCSVCTLSPDAWPFLNPYVNPVLTQIWKTFHETFTGTETMRRGYLSDWPPCGDRPSDYLIFICDSLTINTLLNNKGLLCNILRYIARGVALRPSQSRNE